MILDAIVACADGKSKWPLFLCGNPGAGKTRAALYLTDLYAFSSAYIAMPQFVERVRRAQHCELWEGDNLYATSEYDLIESVKRCKLIVVDEIGIRQTKVSDNEYETTMKLWNVVETLGRPSLWISNLEPEKLAKVYDDRFVSRICSGTVCLCDTKDQRIEPC